MSFKGLLSAVAPIVGGIFGGPLGAAVGSKVSQILMPGVENPSDEQLSLALSKATPEQMIEIKKLNVECEVQLAQIYADDVKNARNREIEVKDWTPRILAYTITAGYFALLFLFFVDSLTVANAHVFDVLLGALTTVFVNQSHYYFGGGKEKK